MSYFDWNELICFSVILIVIKKIFKTSLYSRNRFFPKRVDYVNTESQILFLIFIYVFIYFLSLRF